jgi:hypothetical protein
MAPGLDLPGLEPPDIITAWVAFTGGHAQILMRGTGKAMRAQAEASARTFRRGQQARFRAASHGQLHGVTIQADEHRAAKTPPPRRR